MILDNEATFAHQQAYGTAAGTYIDLGVTRPGPGQPIKCFIQGNGLTGATGFTITDGTTSSAADAHSTIVASIVDDIFEFELPSDIARYVNVTVTGTLSAGTWSAGIVMAGVQTAV